MSNSTSPTSDSGASVARGGWTVGEVLSEQSTVQGRHQDELETTVLGECVTQPYHHEVTNPVTLVDLVDNNMCDRGEQRVTTQQGPQQ